MLVNKGKILRTAFCADLLGRREISFLPAKHVHTRGFVLVYICITYYYSLLSYIILHYIILYYILYNNPSCSRILIASCL